jgi:hydrogenase maturation protein HypF
MACSWLIAAQGEERPPVPGRLRSEVDDAKWDEVCELVRSGVASPITTSAGRLFDAVSATCGLRSRVNYEGQAAVELEAAADPLERRAYPLQLIDTRPDGNPGQPGEAALLLDARETIRALVSDLARGVSIGQASARFHNAVAGATAEACEVQAEARGIEKVVLSGGVFQNRLLLERTAQALSGHRLRVLIPEKLPPNDGGISYGQVAVAAARLTD